MRNKVAKAISEYCQKNSDGFLVAGDAGFGVWDEFQENMPKQYINPGINEQATIGFTAGMALSGHTVFYYNIIPFVMMRCYEQVRNDICYQNLPVILIGIGSGITYAPAGHTHYSVEDITIARSLPNLNIFSPSDSQEAIACLEYAIKSKKPSYIRIAKAGEKTLHTNKPDITKPIFIQNAQTDKLLLVHGSIADEVEQITDNLNIDVATVPFLNSDFNWDTLFANYKQVFTLEEHFVDGGFGSLLQERSNKKINKLGIKNGYIHKIGDRDYLRKYYAIAANDVVTKIKELSI